MARSDVQETERHLRVEDAIDRWHESGPDHPDPTIHGPLHEYLGWTWDEYGLYVQRNELPEDREGAL